MTIKSKTTKAKPKKDKKVVKKTVKSTDISVDLRNISNNKSKKKTKKINAYGLVTELVKKYKESNDDKVMIEIIENLSGIINSFTIMLSPAHNSQQIFFNPYMKKFLFLFMTPEEKVNTTYEMYMQIVYRLRWTIRHYTYEDIYSTVVSSIIDVVKKMNVIEGCDCIYYIQFIVKFAMQNFIIKHSKDAISCIIDLPKENNTNGDSDSGSNGDTNE